MLDFNTIYKNHFEHRLITGNKLKKFAEIHLERSIANNSEVAELIADTTSALRIW